MLGEKKTRWEQNKNANFYFQQILEAAPSNSRCTATLFSSHSTSKEDELDMLDTIGGELIRKFPQLTTTHGHINIVLSTLSYQVHLDTEYCLVELLKAMDDWKRWRVKNCAKMRQLSISMPSVSQVFILVSITVASSPIFCLISSKLILLSLFEVGYSQICCINLCCWNFQSIIVSLF